MLPDDIARQIGAHGGRVTFARFMDLALTHPTEGYYSRFRRLLGPHGHFSTAPRLSPEFNRAVARLLAELVDSWGRAAEHGGAPTLLGEGVRPSVIELGGGEGDLAWAVLDAWEETRTDLRAQVVYSIVEIGDRLRARQSEVLSPALTKGWKVRWASDLVEAAAGTRPCVIVGNEFVDALPVHLVDVRGPRPTEAWVTIDDGPGGERAKSLREIWDGISPEVEVELRALFGTVDTAVLRPLSADGVIEVRPALRLWMERIGTVMPTGSLLTIDYGEWNRGPGTFGVAAPLGSTPGTSLPHRAPSGGPSPQGVAPPPAGERVASPPGETCRSCDPARGALYRRTVRGYFRHQLVADPYVRVGSQDLTADVDFGALDLHGREAGFETVLFTTVAALLRADGGEDRLSELLQRASSPTDEALEADREARVLDGLLDPGGLGGAFKVMLQVRE